MTCFLFVRAANQVNTLACPLGDYRNNQRNPRGVLCLAAVYKI